MSPEAAQIYQIKVTLKDSHPPIWRRILVSGDTTLFMLHYLLQTVMGWSNSHLHMFTIGGLIYSVSADDEWAEFGTHDEVVYRLNQTSSTPKNSIWKRSTRRCTLSVNEARAGKPRP